MKLLCEWGSLQGARRNSCPKPSPLPQAVSEAHLQRVLVSRATHHCLSPQPQAGAVQAHDLTGALGRQCPPLVSEEQSFPQQLDSALNNPDDFLCTLP